MKRLLIAITVLALAIVACVCIFFAFRKNTNELTHIEQAHDSIKLPSYLVLKEKSVDDQRKDDPALSVLVKYRYTLRASKSLKDVDRDLQKSLSSNGYPLTLRYTTLPAHAYSFDAQQKNTVVNARTSGGSDDVTDQVIVTFYESR